MVEIPEQRRDRGARRLRIATSAEIEEETDAIARRLARLTARSDLDRPRESGQASPETPRTVRVIDGEGRAVDGRRFDLHLSDGRRLPGRTGPMPLPTGASSLDVSFENGPRIRIEAPSADVVVTLAP